MQYCPLSKIMDPTIGHNRTFILDTFQNSHLERKIDLTKKYQKK